MKRDIICIECPAECALTVEIRDKKALKITGNKCPKGEAYARGEVESPKRFLTSTVLSKGLSIKMVPVRTDKPVPKKKMAEAMKKIKKIRITKNVRSGDIIRKNFLIRGTNLVITRSTF